MTRATRVLRALFCACIAVASNGCDGDDPDPAGPGNPLSLNPFSTATQPEAGEVRVQVRARVTEGLQGLDQAVQGGFATVIVSFSGSPGMGVGTPLLGTAGTPTCPGPTTIDISGTVLSVARAWLEADVVGIDFCVRNLMDQRTFASIVLTGLQLSNTVRTTCAPSGAIVACLSA